MLRNDLTKLIPDKNQEDFKPGVSVSKAVIVSAWKCALQSLVGQGLNPSSAR